MSRRPTHEAHPIDLGGLVRAPTVVRTPAPPVYRRRRLRRPDEPVRFDQRVHTAPVTIGPPPMSPEPCEPADPQRRPGW